MTAAQLQALRELAALFADDKPALSEAIHAAIFEIERLAEALRDARAKIAERASIDDARHLLLQVFQHYEPKIRKSMFPLDAPGHAHNKPGCWDKDATPCEWCATWARVRAFHAAEEGGRPMKFELEQIPGAAIVIHKRTPRPRSRIPRSCRRSLRTSWWVRRVDYLGFAT